MSRILLCGAFGQGNPGDEALREAFTRTLHGHDVGVASTDPALGPVGHVPATAVGVGRALRGADAVVVAGGTIFKTLHPTAGRPAHALLARTALLLAAARAQGIPAALVGVGAGELRTRTARHLAAHIARRADLLVLRDEESAAVLDDAGAVGPFRIGADAAWTVVDPPTPAHRDGALVVISHLVHRQPDRALSLLRTVVGALTDHGLPVALEPWQPADDELARRARASARPGAVEVLPSPTSLQETVARAAAHRVAVTGRFHGLVAASAAGTPCLALAHEPKLAGLARRLAQPAVPPHAAPAVVRAAVGELLDAGPVPADAVAAQRAHADHGMRLLRLVVSGGREAELVDRSTLALSQGVPW